MAWRAGDARRSGRPTPKSSRTFPATLPAPSGAPCLALAITPRGALHLDPHATASDVVAPDVASGVREAFARSSANGLVHLASAALDAELPASLVFGRDLAKLFFTHLCAVADLRARVDRIWDAFWSGGISNPLEVIEQIT